MKNNSTLNSRSSKLWQGKFILVIPIALMKKHTKKISFNVIHKGENRNTNIFTVSHSNAFLSSQGLGNLNTVRLCLKFFVQNSTDFSKIFTDFETPGKSRIQHKGSIWDIHCSTFCKNTKSASKLNSPALNRSSESADLRIKVVFLAGREAGIY